MHMTMHKTMQGIGAGGEVTLQQWRFTDLRSTQQTAVHANLQFAAARHLPVPLFAAMQAQHTASRCVQFLELFVFCCLCSLRLPACCCVTGSTFS
jgi:hypothetical protein